MLANLQQQIDQEIDYILGLNFEPDIPITPNSFSPSEPLSSLNTFDPLNIFNSLDPTSPVESLTFSDSLDSQYSLDPLDVLGSRSTEKLTNSLSVNGLWTKYLDQTDEFEQAEAEITNNIEKFTGISKTSEIAEINHTEINFHPPWKNPLNRTKSKTTEIDILTDKFKNMSLHSQSDFEYCSAGNDQVVADFAERFRPSSRYEF
ncbi:uncharacterized protein V1516DRAFT_678518 [Lipomyces oligophaga]|uniref:uncharacterized protein n=1 Tax=Lipomyces oligophaga TaxID=45792 RepID=UPI0034CFB413